MTNLEIKNKISELQMNLRQLMLEGVATFELNTEVAKANNKINALRQQCTHLNEEGLFEIINGHCPYCGKKVK